MNTSGKNGGMIKPRLGSGPASASSTSDSQEDLQVQAKKSRKRPYEAYLYNLSHDVNNPKIPRQAWTQLRSRCQDAEAEGESAHQSVPDHSVIDDDDTQPQLACASQLDVGEDEVSSRKITSI